MPAVSKALLLLVGVFPLACSGCTVPRPADLIVLGGSVWTGDPSAPRAEAVAVRGERIVAVGPRRAVEELQGPDTRVVDAAGGLVIPGFIDAHVHFLEGGFGLASVQLRDAATPEEFARRIGEFAAGLQPGEWITRGDWDHELWGGELPHRDWIDAVTPDNPVWVNRLDGHMALANSAALEAAGVDAGTPDVEGGEIVRDADGRPTGVLKDNAMALVERAVPEPSLEARRRALDSAMEHVAAQGVTSVHHMGTWQDLVTFRHAAQAGELRTRITACVPLSEWRRLEEEVRGAREAGRVDGAANVAARPAPESAASRATDSATPGDATSPYVGGPWLRFGCLKGYVDGSLGSHTAAFFEPFSDAPGDTGLLVNAPEDLRSWIADADADGLHVVVHAIGDRAIDLLLDIYAETVVANGPRDRRFRMEHAQHIRPEDIPRFEELGVIASMQPYHAIDDGRWAERVIGPVRIRTTYAFRSLLDAGTRLAFGSDWPVAPATPLEGIYAAVTRRTIDGANPGGWVPEQKISVEEALRAYTADAAYAAYQESELGTLETGKLADLVVIDRDLTDVPPEQLADARILLTVVGGRVVHDPVDAETGSR